MSDQTEENKKTDDVFAKTNTKKKTAKRAYKKREKKVELPDLSKHAVVVTNKDGTDTEGIYRVSKVTSKAVFLEEITKDMRTIILKGKEETFDFNLLKTLNPESEVRGVKVSSLITAIELA